MDFIERSIVNIEVYVLDINCLKSKKWIGI